MTLNGIVSHEDRLLNGVELNGRTYKNHIDGYNLLDYLSGKSTDDPRKPIVVGPQEAIPPDSFVGIPRH